MKTAAELPNPELEAIDKQFQMEKAAAAAKLDATAAAAVKDYLAYRLAGNKALALAALSGHKWAAVKDMLEKRHINIGKWAAAQRELDPDFPTIQWINRLIQLSKYWEAVKGVTWLSSVEQAIAYGKGQLTGTGEVVRHKKGDGRPRKIDGRKLTAALAVRHLEWTAAELVDLLNAVGVKCVVVEAPAK